jgi:hypothetical protein
MRDQYPKGAGTPTITAALLTAARRCSQPTRRTAFACVRNVGCVRVHGCAQHALSMCVRVLRACVGMTVCVCDCVCV